MLIFTLLILLGLENVIAPEHASALDNQIMANRLALTVEAKAFSDPTNLVHSTDADIGTYEAAKLGIEELRKQLQDKYNQKLISLEEVKSAFANYLVDRIIPFWYGTPWSFEGHTARPKQGEIACGYFISTTLRDMGLKLNRYKLAQQSPMDEAKILSCGTNVQRIEQESHEKALEDIHRLTGEGLYFIGFDTGHVAYLLKRKGQLVLIHSNYYVPRQVCMEPFETSKVFNSYSRFYLVAVSHNDVLIQHWLNNGTVL